MATILLAEDSPTHTALIRSLLEESKHKVQCFGNGREAYDAIESSHPSLVVTDLRMPEMNGQELVQEMVRNYPSIPSIVVTARGSENLAVDALALGAANFVPKNSLHMLLGHVVRQTLRMIEADSRFDHFPGRLRRPEFSIRLLNEIRGIEPAVLFVVQAIAAAGELDMTQRVRIGTAVASAIFNCMCFGNLELDENDDLVSRLLSGDRSGAKDLHRRASESPYRDRYIDLKVSVGRKDTRISVSHSGPGRVTRLKPAPGTPESFELEQCRGLMLITSFMDEVVFHSGYSEVVMVKRHSE